MEPHTYTWIFALGMIFAFLDAYGIGANDVANSFATSVGSRSLTLAQACGIAIFTEFGGAVLLGAETTETIKNKIIDISLYKDKPEVLALSFLCALVASSFWVITASKMGWPVSTTHSIVGAVAGAGIAGFGFNTVVWGWGGMGKIIASWFISPAASALVASGIFMITKLTVLQNARSFERGLKAMAFYVFFTFSILIFYLINKSPKGIDLSKTNSKGEYINSRKVGMVLGIAFGVSAFLAILCQLLAVPFLRRRLSDGENLKWYHIFYVFAVPEQPKTFALPMSRDESSDTVSAEKDEKEVSKPAEVKIEETETKAPTQFSDLMNSTKTYLLRGLTMDVASHQGDKTMKALHDDAIKYDSKTEYLYSALQVCTAAFASFAHGSNDVANAVGPISAIYAIWSNGVTPSSSTTVPFWILAYGGIAIDLGLALFGFNVMKNLGNNLTYHSPSRGFSMELGAALTVITASFLGVPVSTTHCITGATVGVGLCSGKLSAVNWKMVAWTVFSWILTVPVVATIAGTLTLLLLSSPHL